MLSAAVIGCGAMGRNHLRVLADLPGVRLAAAVDGAPDARDQAARRYGVPTFATAGELLRRDRPDLAIVAVPTQDHAAAVGACLEAGVHTLVEKPIAADLAQARALADAARAAGLLLAVGHVERCNPAVVALKRRLEAGELGRVFQARVRRLGPFPARIRDVGVVLDLATHDLDILRYLVGGRVVRLFAETEQRIHTAHEDLLSALLRFEHGAVASLEINWLTPTKERTLALTGERGMFVVDYLLQDLFFYANDRAATEWEALRAVTGVGEGSMTRFALERREPLRVELERFVAAVHARRVGAPDPVDGIVTAEDGVEALRLATLLVESGRSGRAIDVAPSDAAR